ncbi:LLM class flavin-dependent oxidoreductase [Nocardia terpenica]|uniref:MupA/Atu3671 family FMN-dependent luciferase-like monooxygenase n=1 Tax=Nocardia terpenica TaxID=455432 RepID=UPI001895E542|nr:MupA/Atu3671 family FMN-dependent luciferase-like monooxygenase [Nocardia terpenica]MBF6059960.1 LLM class flavin-dependent oxidoreductase [Nocardia terpenica]MBF6102499.1 LLM class flavin-dependent oxidoreductase [Nocardia terpenica]MBF6111310.1 LLM class flavin-dependent oxidoreductase [Nocardia terpenica]MBF6117441.1 LLM class flavin-dependent oxidoreductase [Nocardia terpenica]MBF6150718.1 LLM class flavin-dependent oxidoreductase [Nocardia terpenica]
MSEPPGDTGTTAFFLEWVRQRLGRDSVDPRTPLTALGLDSVKAAELLTMLEDRFGTEISVEDIYADMSVADLAEQVLIQWNSETEIANSAPVGSAGGDGGLEFGLFFFASDAQQYSAQRYRLLLDSARFADEHGFTAIWVPERHFHKFGGLYPNPAVLGAALATTTQRVRIRAGSVVLPLHNPVRVAEDWSVVDNLSHGRVDVAFATGWNPDDFVLAADSYRTRAEVTRSGMDSVQQLWRGESISLPNGVGDTRSVRIFPPPIQPQLPTWVTCSGSVERFEMAGELGANVLTALLFQSVDELGEKIAAYRKARARHGHDADGGTVTVMLHTFVGDQDAMVRQTVRGPFRSYLEDSVDLWRRGLAALDSLDDRARNKVLDFAFERYYRTSGLFGTPDSALSMVGNLRAAGADEIACLIDFGVAESTVLSGLESLAVLKDKALSL